MATALLLKRASERPAGSRQPDERTGTGEDAGRVLVCTECLHAITTTGARIEMSGSHAHTFSNPTSFGLTSPSMHQPTKKRACGKNYR